jgi:N-acetylglucosamine-6-phosphate deacetylase
VYVGEDRVPRADEGNHLVGSATSVGQMIENLRQHLQLSEEAIQQLTSIGPSAILQVA